MRPERGGHSNVNVLLLSVDGSKSPASAQAATTFPLDCLTSPSSNGSPAGAGLPVSSSNSR